MKKLISLAIAGALAFSATFAQSVTPAQQKLIDSYSYDQLITARSTIAQKWDSYTPAQKTKIRGYLRLIKAKLDVLPVPTTSSSSSISSSSSSVVSSSSSSTTSNVSSSSDSCSDSSKTKFIEDGKKLSDKGNNELNSIMSNSNLLSKYLLIAQYCKKNNLNGCFENGIYKGLQVMKNIKTSEENIALITTQIQDHNNEANNKFNICKVTFPIIGDVGRYSASYKSNPAYDTSNFSKFIYNSFTTTTPADFETAIKDLDNLQNVLKISGSDFVSIVEDQTKNKTSFEVVPTYMPKDTPTNYDSSNKYTCSQFYSCSEAKAAYYAGASYLDKNNDGIPCEVLCSY